MMENVQEKLERACERINELQNKNLELRERNSSLLKEQIQARAIIEKQNESDTGYRIKGGEVMVFRLEALIFISCITFGIGLFLGLMINVV